MPMSEAKRRSNKKWNDANLSIRYDRIQLVVPKGRKATIEGRAKENGETVNGYISKLIRNDLNIPEGQWKNVGLHKEDDGGDNP